MSNTMLDTIKADMKEAMRAKEKSRLQTIRLILSAVKQYEVDERKDVSEAVLISILTKMVKQRKDSISMYEEAKRTELADIEKAEIAIIQQYLPQQLSEAEVSAIIDQAISDTGASTMQDMGKVMGLIKPKLEGRADLGQVSGTIRAKLS
jgi:uncharacterized protein